MELPEHIKQKIWDRIHEMPDFDSQGWGEFGYSLAQQEIEEIKEAYDRADKLYESHIVEPLRQEIKERDEEINEYSRNLKNAVDNGSKLTNDLYQANKEIERLKGLIDELLKTGYSGLENHESQEFISNYKTLNNL